MHIEVTHPCVQHKLSLLRDADTGHTQFRQLTREITQFLCYEALQHVPVAPVTVRTPLGEAPGHQIAADIVVVPILRAGVGMLDGVLELVPTARVGFVGLYRDADTKLPIEYYRKLPPARAGSLHIVIDPMLATGGSTAETLSMLKKNGATRIIVIAIVSCPEGLAAVAEAHDDVPVYVAAVDSHLDARKYIVPGLGDAGDRLYGTR